MTWNAITANNGNEVSNLFASFFRSIYESNTDIPSATINQHKKFLTNQDVNLSELNVRYEDMFNQLRKLDTRKGAGPDGIPNLFLKNCAPGLTELITHIFSKSLELDVFPATWKTSLISPIHKSGSRCEVSDYRPVCIQSSISKLFEKIVLPYIISTFQDIISTKKRGFIGGRSTATNLYLYTNYVLNA